MTVKLIKCYPFTQMKLASIELLLMVQMYLSLSNVLLLSKLLLNVFFGRRIYCACKSSVSLKLIVVKSFVWFRAFFMSSKNNLYIC